MTENSEPKIAGLLLAAGGSSRLGHPKQLVEFKGKTLIRRAAEAQIGAGCSPVIVVLGAEIERSRKELDGLDLRIVINESWESGMGSSIAAGIANLPRDSVDAALISVCDQPLITADHLREFVEVYQNTRSEIIAAEYNGIRGVPALFSEELFDVLASLREESGARDVIRARDSVGIKLPEAAADIDTPADLPTLNRISL